MTQEIDIKEREKMQKAKLDALPKEFLGLFNLYEAQHIIGAFTWAMCITECVFFTLYFDNRNKIEYFAVGI